jgi:hypothetical protein
MNDLYNISITHPTNGLEYHYDPDHDCFYRRYADPDSANADFNRKYGWIIWTLILAAITFVICLHTDPEFRALVASWPIP